jgi:hypothetical protein
MMVSVWSGAKNTGKELELEQNLDEVWRKFGELNDLKNSIWERNDDMKVEIDSFKTHFSKYDA